MPHLPHLRSALAAGLALTLPILNPLPGNAQWLPPGANTQVIENLAELPGDELARLISTLEEEMAEASADLRFEYAARLRDEIKDLKREMREVG